MAADGNPRDYYVWLLLRTALLFGASNHSFDREKHRFVYSSGAFVWRVSLHMACLGLVVLNLNHILEDTENLLSRSSFVMGVAYVSIGVNAVVVAHSLVSEWLCRGQGTELFNALLKVRIENVTKLKGYRKVQRSMWKLLLLETLSAILLTLTVVLTSVTQCRPTFRMIAGMVALDILRLGHISIQFQFAVALLYGGHLFKVLNLRLSQLVADVNVSPRFSDRKCLRLGVELNRLASSHSNLLRLLVRLKDVYQFDLLVVLSALFAGQVCSIFFAVVAYEGMLIEMTLTGYLIECGNTIAGTIALLICLYICEDCIKACDASGAILRDLRASPVLHKPLKRDVEALCLQLAREKMRLSICGMFDLDIDTGPVMIEGVCLKVVLLTQIGYHNLR